MATRWLSMKIATRRVMRQLGLTATHTTVNLPKVRDELVQRWIQAEGSQANDGRAARYCTFTFGDADRLYNQPSARWHWLDREMSSNIAGETGACAIYEGALAAMALRRRVGVPLPAATANFVHDHLRAERRHLQLMESVVAPTRRTILLPVWRVAGFVLGFVPTVTFGSEGLFLTVYAVESFVEEHYNTQIGPLKEQGASPELVKLLQQCCADEVHHKEDALVRMRSHDEPHIHMLERAWVRIVVGGSALAAEIARRL